MEKECEEKVGLKAATKLALVSLGRSMVLAQVVVRTRLGIPAIPDTRVDPCRPCLWPAHSVHLGCASLAHAPSVALPNTPVLAAYAGKGNDGSFTVAFGPRLRI